MYFLTNCPFQLSQICLYVKNLSKQDWAAKCFEVSVCHQGGEVGACPKNKSCHLCHNCHNNENLDIRCAISKLDDRPVGAHINYLSISIGLNLTVFFFAKYTMIKSRFALRSPCCLVICHSSHSLSRIEEKGFCIDETIFPNHTRPHQT